MKVWKVILAVLVIFGAGVVTGGLTVRFSSISNPARKKPAPPNQLPLRWWSQQRTEFLNRMDRQLQLSGDQRQAIEGILQQSQQQMQEIWDKVAPLAREESRKTRESILEQLSPEQRARFNEVFKPRTNHPPALRRRLPGDHKRREPTNAEPSERKL